MARIKIKASKNGPYVIEIEDGKFEVNRGSNVEMIEKRSIALCRCGQSENKPFCDGTHRKVGFNADEVKIEII